MRIVKTSGGIEGVKGGGGRINPADGRAFTIIELLLVVTIIGLMAAMALPHLGGFTRTNTIATASQQLLSDANLARQQAIATRSTVYMVFVPTNFWTSLEGASENSLGYYSANPIVSNLLSHQCAAYALVSLRSVGDQPGRSYPRYLTDWKTLPDGSFIAPFKFATNPFAPIHIYSTNTLGVVGNNVTVSTTYPFNYITVPFPSVATSGGTNNVALPCIGFTGSGGLVPLVLPNGVVTNTDQYIPLDLGSILYQTAGNGGATVGQAVIGESPPGNATNSCNLLHLSWLTGRAKIERNQF